MRVRLLALAVFAALTVQTPIGAQLDAGTVVNRAARYVSDFVWRFTRVVSEERYVQDLRTRARGLMLSTQHREWKADFLLVRTTEAGGWMAFRDVFEVNQTPIRDRSDRLSKLFLESPSAAMSRAQAISSESARYNIGPRRTVNNPVLALAFLQDAYRPRFSFSVGGDVRMDGVDAVIVDYREAARPTLIRNNTGDEVPVSGRYWVDEASGSILKTELTADDRGQHSIIVVTFRMDDRLKLRVPVEMEEDYELQDGTTINAVAKYSRFRQFEVTTDELPRD
ncbi:MAG TPA: hypothetical protein VJP86_12900 [Vicinamibacterales bacterium]|nr:hypothetical protein [Vicinamibacterales bacterium]